MIEFLSSFKIYLMKNKYENMFEKLYSTYKQIKYYLNIEIM